MEDEISRQPLAPATDDQRMKHHLTHQPYASWCEFCIGNRSREECSTFVYGYVSRLDDEKESEAHSALCPRPTQEEDALGAETIERRKVTGLSMRSWLGFSFTLGIML